MSRWNLAWLVGITAANFIALSIHQFAPSQGPLQSRHENYRLMVEVVEEVQAKYVKELDKKRTRELFEDMINLGLEQLDPHSGFINAEEYAHFKKTSKGKFGGVGIKINMNRARELFVESPIVGTPAYEAGVEAGDIITKIDGKSTEGMSMKQAVDLITGEPGSKVVLTILHEYSDKPVEVTLTRAEIVIESVMGDVRNHLKQWDFMMDPVHRIAYIRITQFTETTAGDLAKVVEQLQKDKVRGLILDLRTNPGGLLKSAVEVSSLFLPEGKTVVSTKGRDGKGEVYVSKRAEGAPPPMVDVPIAILLNRYSASASEIVAAALEDHARAVIVGERSYGKGSVQNIIPLEGGTTALKLTTASYWRPSEKNIHRFRDSKESDEWGVKPTKNPDLEVKLTDQEFRAYFKYRRERDVIRKTETSADADQRWMLVPWNVEVLRPEPFKDRVLEKALDYLRGKTRQAGAAPALPPGDSLTQTPPARQPAVGANPTGQAVLDPREIPEFFRPEEIQ
jgi:carboxyl-terminal processing protease